MGSKGSNTTTTQQASSYAPTGAPYINTALNTAQSAATTPYQAYGGQLVAPVNAQQQQGIGNINAAAGVANPAFNSAIGYANNLAQPLTADQISQYQNPYTQSVINATQAQFANQNAQQQQQVTGNAAAQGALGGDRVGVAQAQLANQQNLAQAPVIAGLYNQSYAQALQTAQQQQQNQGAAAYALGNLGSGLQNSQLSGANAQLQAGGLEQQTQQQQDTAQYQQFLNQLAYPFQTSQFLTQAVGALAPALGGNSTGSGSTTAPAPNPLNSILGGLGTVASFLPSDERIKENIQPIGKLFDGTGIYRYNFKGDNTTRIGLIAQEVEGKHPEAVAESSDGVKMVDHQRATDDAAGRQKFAGGGLALPYSAQGYVPSVSNFQVSQAPMPQLPKVTPGTPLPDNTQSMVKSAMGLAGSLKSGWNSLNDSLNASQDQKTMDGYKAQGLEPGVGATGPELVPIGGSQQGFDEGGFSGLGAPQPSFGGDFGGFGGIDNWARGGLVKGYDDGGTVTPDAGSLDSPSPFSPDASVAQPMAAASPQSLGDLFRTKETQYKLPTGYLNRVARGESNYDASAQNPNSSAGGLFQFIDSTAKQYGLTNRFDPAASTDAAARLAADNYRVMSSGLGRSPTVGELALAHQQGAGGALKLLANPTASAASLVGADAVALNGGTRNTPAGVFAARVASDSPALRFSADNDNSPPAGLPAEIAEGKSTKKQPVDSTVAGVPTSNPFAGSLSPQSGLSQTTKTDDGVPSWYPFPKLSDATKQQLMATGFGMMASKSPFLGAAIGEGGLKGIDVSQKAQELSRLADVARATIAHTTAQTGLVNEQTKAYPATNKASVDLTKAQTEASNVSTEAARDTLQATRKLRENPMFGDQAATPGVARAIPSAAVIRQPQSNDTTPGPQSGASSVPGLPAIASDAKAVVDSTAGVMRTPDGLVAVNAAGQPIENLATTYAKGHAMINSLVPAYVSAGEALVKHADEMVKLGGQITTDGGVVPLKGAQETAARGAGMKAGAEARAKAPTEILTSMVREGARPVTVGPNQTATTGSRLDPKVQTAVDWALSNLNPGGSSTDAPPATLGVPSSDRQASQFTPHLVQNPDGSFGSSVTPGVEAVQKGAAALYEEAGKTAHASQVMQYRLSLIDHDLDQLNSDPNSWYETGPSNDTRLNIARTMNTLADVIGVKKPFDPEKVAAWEDLNKESTQLGFATARTLGAREAMQIVQGAIQANPNALNTPLGAKLVLNSIRYAAKADTDFYDYMTKFAQEHGGDLVGAQTAFYKEHPPSSYANAALAAGNAPTHVAYLRAHPETADQFDKNYGSGVAAIILGLP